MVGGRVTLDLSDKWSTILRGDIGGFGIGSSSEFTWNASLLFQYEMTQRSSLLFGYRYMSQDYEDSSKDFEYDVDTSEPVLAVGFNV